MLHGLAVPVPTVFDPDGAIDPGASGAFVRTIASAGADHILLLGALGESALVEDAERRILLESTLESLPAKSDAWVGVGAPGTRRSVRLALAAEEAGAAALIAAPPYGLRLTTDALAHYYQAIREATKIPIVVENAPALAGSTLTPELVHRLARERVIDGITDGSGFLESVAGFLRGAPEGFAVFSGEDALALAAVEKGAAGAALPSANVVPKLGVALVRAARAHETARANELQVLVTRVGEAIRSGPFPATVKFLAGQAWGARVGYRSPGEPLTPEEERTVLGTFEPLRPVLRPFL
ncbi:MAG: dihydrodipicolinate synthase family protein [Thermoplasmata archaeon]|nr:dihydrodipicolinate synthase family protein [Thermoplasmata archaeon]